MSLRVWLPLVRDLSNQGLSDITVTNNGATVDNSGKLGKCYSFGTSTSYLTLSNDAMNKCTTKCSISFWLNITSWNTSYATYFQAGLGGTPWTHYIFGVLRNNATSNLCFTISNGSSASNASYTTSNLELNTWYHLTFVYKTGHCLIFINGELYKDYATTIVPNFSGITKTTVGACNNSSNYQTNCKINDLRIYDHALSSKEVQLLSQGLVCHYKLDNNGVGTPSIFNFSNSARWYADGVTLSHYIDPTFGDVLNVVAESGQTRIYKNVTNIWTINQVYAVSFLARASSTAKCTMSRSLVNFSSEFSLTTEWKRYVGTITSTATVDAGTLSFQVTTLGVDVYITEIKLEYGDVATPYCPNANSPEYNMFGYNENMIYDSSGYNYHGTSTDLTVFTNSARNSLSTKFNGTSSKIVVTSPFASTVKNSQMSFAFWMNRNNYTDGIARYIYYDYCYIYIHTDYKMRITWEHDTASSSARNTWATGLSVPANEWHHVCFTFSDGVMKVYCDGTLNNTSDRSNTGQFMGVRNTGGTLGVANTDNYFGGSISDFRIYATALSADDILELYQTSASIDKNGNLYAYELKEG